MNLFYDKIMSVQPEGFLCNFNKRWDTHLSNINKKYIDSDQLSGGHRLRPLLCAWGALAGNYNSEYCINSILEGVLDTAVSTELIHKCSIIIDDIIDEDIARRGKPTFHVEHGSYESIVLVIQMLALSIKILNNSNKDRKANVGILNQSIDLISSTIFDMAKGTIDELLLDKEKIYKFIEIKKVVDMQTTSLIKNSFLLGYLSSSNPISQISNYVTEIGELLGFVFQLLNDAEVFSNNSFNIKYKGNLNFDLNKLRKNIIVSYIYNFANLSEKKTLRNIENLDFTFLENLYKKYNVEMYLIKRINIIKNNIIEDIEQIYILNGCLEWIDGIKIFLDYVMDYCLKRLISD
ncbi:polyprenyl synthetase family protein [Paenibacillus wenxiniae]|uniref:Polyprenyl synthetase family protein n=1 Tax=Paenibacillus wenxiniae TaxID=1636843 RepID=A0ABW4RQF5_9BACL